MNIFKKIKNQLDYISLSIFSSLPTDKKENIIITKESDEEKISDISEEDAIKFAENAIEYTPENKIKMITYYQEDRDKPKKRYIVGQVGTRLDLESRESLGNGFKVKRNNN